MEGGEGGRRGSRTRELRGLRVRAEELAQVLLVQARAEQAGVRVGRLLDGRAAGHRGTRVVVGRARQGASGVLGGLCLGRRGLVILPN